MDVTALRERTVLVIGGHGMMGRPVVRRLMKDGFVVSVLARRPAEAARSLPPAARIIKGDLKDVASIDAALQGCRAVYVSVDSRPKDIFRCETQGLRNVIDAAANHQNPRLLVLSALGVSDPKAANHPWKHLREKHEAQRLARESSLPWTIFEPTWFMESLPLFVRKFVFSNISVRGFRPYWIAGDDYARMISAGLKSGAGIEEIVPVQGHDAFSLEEAGRLFIEAYDRRIRVRNVPFWLIKMAGWFNKDAGELATVMEMSGAHAEPAPDPETWRRFAEPKLTIPGYAAYSRETGDFPQK
jgi:uncharacterized protein YbjT (DUF2867 family)